MNHEIASVTLSFGRMSMRHGTWSAPDIQESRKARKTHNSQSAGVAQRGSSSSDAVVAFAPRPEEFAVFCDNVGLVSDCLPNSTQPMSWHVHWRDGRHAGVEQMLQFDVTRAAFFNNKLLVSRKRNTQMSDLASVWKKSVLNNFNQFENELDWDMDE